MVDEIRGAITEDTEPMQPKCGFCNKSEPVIETVVQEVDKGMMKAMTYCSHCGAILGITIFQYLLLNRKKGKILTIT